MGVLSSIIMTMTVIMENNSELNKSHRIIRCHLHITLNVWHSKNNNYMGLLEMKRKLVHKRKVYGSAFNPLLTINSIPRSNCSLRSH